MVHTATEAEFMFPLDWQPLGVGVGRPSGALSVLSRENTIASGAFTVEADRSVVAQLGQVALDSKIEHLSNSGRPSLQVVLGRYNGCSWRFEMFQVKKQVQAHLIYQESMSSRHI